MEYLLGIAAKRYKLLLHGWVVMSNHLHIIVTDVAGRLPDAMQWLVLQSSKGVSAEIGRWKGIWDKDRYSRVELLGRCAVVAKIVYTVANPVSARLVRRAHRWPGATSATFRFGESRTVHRPDRYFTGASWEDAVTLKLEPPPGMSEDEMNDIVPERVRRREKAVRRLMRRHGQSRFLGEKRVQRQDPYDCTKSWEKRRGLNPTFASTDKWKRIEAAQRKRTWETEYRAALEAYRAGDEDVVFPAGTWGMVQWHRCCVARI